MKKLVFDQDEVILLEEGYTRYSGSIEGVNSLDKLILTNKRILGVWSKRKEEGILEIPASEIKRYKNSLCVDDFDSHGGFYGECLRVQTVKGIELFNVTDPEPTSIKEDLRDVFIGKKGKAKDKNTVAWVEKIKEAFGDAKSLEAPQEPKIVEHAPTTTKGGPVPSPVKEKLSPEEPIKKGGKIIICPSCGEEYPTGSKFCPHCGADTSKPKVVEVEKTVEVAICRKCGAKMSVDTKFCPSCGAPVIEEEKRPVPEPKRESRESKIEKCQVCGEILPSDAVVCPSCGHEIRGREAVVSVSEFSKTISSIDDEDKKIEAIKNYVIPNSKQDIMEFMLLATSSFDERLYLSSRQGESIATAWRTKVEQCYKKAMLLFTDQNDIRKIENLYNESIYKTKNAKKRKIILAAVGIALIVGAAVLMCVVSGCKNEDGSNPYSWAIFVGLGVLAVGIVSLVFGVKKKKTNKQIEEERIAKMNKKKK